MRDVVFRFALSVRGGLKDCGIVDVDGAVMLAVCGLPLREGGKDRIGRRGEGRDRQLRQRDRDGKGGG